MRVRRASAVSAFLTGLLVMLSPALGQDKPAPAKPAPKPEPKIEFEDDGSIRIGKVVTRYWQVNHEQPGNLVKELAIYLGHPDLSGVKAAPKSQNVLRIEAPEEKWPIIEKLLEVLDVPEPQVYVEAKIIEIKFDSNLEFGFEGGFDRRAATGASQPFFGSVSGNFNPASYLDAAGTSGVWQGGAFDFKTVGGDFLEEHGSLSYIFRAVQERGSAEILSQPSIIATQGKKASIVTGQKFPIQSVEVRGNQTYVTTKFEKTGIQLDITPTLVGRDYVSLDLRASDSQVTERIAGPSGSLNPVIGERAATTQVSVRDGETIIIGGLLTTSTIETKSGLPFLSDIPVLGYFFSATGTREVKSELVFFIKPRIIKRRVQTEASIILPPGERKRLGQ